MAAASDSHRHRSRAPAPAEPSKPGQHERLRTGYSILSLTPSYCAPCAAAFLATRSASSSPVLRRWPPEIMEFFHAIGLPLLEGYAMSENIVPMSMNRPGRFRIGAVGQPLSLNEIRIGDEDELQVKGPGVFSGYYKSAAANDRFTADGFYKTGDAGRFDNDGFLWLTGRTSDILKTSTGRRISPLGIEAALRTSPYIDQVVVFGHGRRHLAALITIQADRVEKELAAKGVSFESKDQMTASPAVHALLQPEIERLTKPFPTYERIRVFAIAPRPFDIASGELTSSLKLRRNVIEKNYAHLLEPLFAAEAAGA